MSSSSHDKSSGGKKKKKDLWKEAGGEFYQERYPGGSGQATSTVDLTETTERRIPRPHIPLPSQTARRNSFIPTGTGRKYFTRKASHSYNTTTINGGGHNCMTYNSTMGGIQDASEVHVALMPDLADETIPNEKTTYEALVKIKALPEPMHQKRLRKMKISGIPQLRLTGWKHFKWEFKKGWKELKRYWIHKNRNSVFFQHSLRTIEIRCGTSIVNVFLFIKWTLLLNILISILIFFFIILGANATNGFAGGSNEGKNCQRIANYSNTSYTGFHDIPERMECCARAYYYDREVGTRGSLSTVANLLFGGFTRLEITGFFYGYYTLPQTNQNYNLHAVAYVLVIVGILFISLLLMVRSVGKGIQELIMATEGEHHEYTNLVFAGWDHYTGDEPSALFKRKILKHEMKVALLSEKQNLESLIRNRKERLKLTAVRIFVNIVVVLLICGAGWIIFIVSRKSLEFKKSGGNDKSKFADISVEDHVHALALGFAPSIIISVFNLIFPVILQKLGKPEKFSAQTETAFVLIRATIIRLMSVGFVAASFYIEAYCEMGEKSLACTKCYADKDNGEKPDRRYCWESLFADLIYKLIIVDLLLKCVLTFIVDPIRLWLRKCFKNKLFQEIGNMKFSIVRHSLDLIYLQALSWLGMYFGPVIPIVCVFYCLAVFYIKKFSVLHNCTAVPDTFKAMKTTTMFVAAKLLAFVVVTFANVHVIGYMTPSRGCGPFMKYDRPWGAVRELVKMSADLNKVYDHVASPGITTPLTMVLALVAYYYYAVAQANRGMVDTLRHLLILEGHDKQYLFARLNSLRRGSPSQMSTRSGHDLSTAR